MNNLQHFTHEIFVYIFPAIILTVLFVIVFFGFDTLQFAELNFVQIIVSIVYLYVFGHVINLFSTFIFDKLLIRGTFREASCYMFRVDDDKRKTNIIQSLFIKIFVRKFYKREYSSGFIEKYKALYKKTFDISLDVGRDESVNENLFELFWVSLHYVNGKNELYARKLDSIYFFRNFCMNASFCFLVSPFLFVWKMIFVEFSWSTFSLMTISCGIAILLTFVYLQFHTRLLNEVFTLFFTLRSQQEKESSSK